MIIVDGTHRLQFAMVVRVAERRPASAALPSPLSAIGVSSSVQIIHFVLARGNVAYHSDRPSAESPDDTFDHLAQSALKLIAIVEHNSRGQIRVRVLPLQPKPSLTQNVDVKTAYH